MINNFGRFYFMMSGIGKAGKGLRIIITKICNVCYHTNHKQQ